jgi:hypothetical protein
MLRSHTVTFAFITFRPGEQVLRHWITLPDDPVADDLDTASAGIRSTARSLVETTKLNCIARYPRERASSKECRHMARAIPRPVVLIAVM